MHTSRKESRKKKCSEPGLQQECFLVTGKEIKIKKEKKLNCTSIYFQIFTGRNLQEKYYTKSSPGQLHLTPIHWWSFI